MNQKYEHDLADKKGQQNNQGKHAQSQGGQENKKAPVRHEDKKDAGQKSTSTPGSSSGGQHE